MPVEISPYDLEAERHVLGSLLIDPEALHRVVPILGEQATVFFRPAHQLIYEAALRVNHQNDPIDLYSVYRELKRSGNLEKAGGLTALHELQDSVPTSAHAEYYARIVKEMAIRRELIDAGAAIIGRAREEGLSLEEVVDHAQALILRINRSERERGLVPFKTLTATMDQATNLYRRDHLLPGISTGLPPLDELLAGLNRSDLIIVAARPSMGKSAFAHNIAAHVAIHQKLPVALFSLEMSQDQIALRILARESGIPLSKIRRGDVSTDAWRRISETVDKIAEAPLFISDAPGITMWEIRSECRRLKLHHPDLALVIVDYLQLIQGASRTAQSREQEISEYSRSLKELARELNVPVIALSQLNRAVEARNDKRPQLADLRESGAIEQDADVVMFLFREEYYDPAHSRPGETEVIVRKHRNGELGTVILRFDQKTLLFAPLDQQAPGYPYS